MKCRRGERGHAYVWMIMAILLLLASALGAARVGSATGDYMRRQVSADAAGKSAADVVAERMRHIGRLQRLGQEAIEERDREIEARDREQDLAQEAEAAGDTASAEMHWELASQHQTAAEQAEERARRCSEAAIAIAEGTPAAARKESERVARTNGASSHEIKGLARANLPNEWWGLMSVPGEFGPPIRWVTIARGFRNMKIDVAVRQTGLDGEKRRADALTAVEPRQHPSGGPILADNWYGRLRTP